MVTRLLFNFLCGCSCLIACSALTVAQSEPQDPHDSSKWNAAIKKFEQLDKLKRPLEHSVLFVGSSSIRRWNLEECFPDLAAINRGFGGSHLADSVKFIDRIVLTYQPQAVVMYAGDNDIKDGKSPERVFADFAEFVAILQKELPQTTLHYISIKPSIKRWKLVEKNRRANRLISSYCDQHEKLFFVDIDKPMLLQDGTLNPVLFAEDGLHLSTVGYQVWNKALRDSLEKPDGTPLGLKDENKPQARDLPAGQRR